MLQMEVIAPIVVDSVSSRSSEGQSMLHVFSREGWGFDHS